MPTRRSSEREPADSLTDKPDAVGGWLPSLTFSLNRHTAVTASASAKKGPTQSTVRFAGITRTPGVCGGHARVEGSRTAVHDVVGLLQNGETVDSVTHQLPGLTRAQVYECLAYYEDHLAEVDYLIARQMAEADA